jgi:AcrR family transcriptional regulator
VAPAKTRRQIGAEQTEGVIVEAAARLFFGRGYGATSVAQIAAEAGVAVQTIYNSVGSKRDLLRRVLDSSAPDERLTIDHADSDKLIQLLVEQWREALPRTASAFRTLRTAAAVDTEIAALERERSAQVLASYEMAARLLEQRGALREGLTVRRAAATIFAIGHPDVYRAVVLDGAWDDSLWATWARTSLKAALLRP